MMPQLAQMAYEKLLDQYNLQRNTANDEFDRNIDLYKLMAEEEGSTFVHPFDDPGVATGQGSIAMEILQELPLVDYVLVPIGGGGLATGVSTLVKRLRPDVKGIGVGPENR